MNSRNFSQIVHWQLDMEEKSVVKKSNMNLLIHSDVVFPQVANKIHQLVQEHMGCKDADTKMWRFHWVTYLTCRLHARLPHQTQLSLTDWRSVETLSPAELRRWLITELVITPSSMMFNEAETEHCALMVQLWMTFTWLCAGRVQSGLISWSPPGRHRNLVLLSFYNLLHPDNDRLRVQPAAALTTWLL